MVMARHLKLVDFEKDICTFELSLCTCTCVWVQCQGGKHPLRLQTLQ